MSDGLRERLIAATAKWRKLDSERDTARDEVLDAATAMLKAGAVPADVVRLTPFSDALVRSETRKRGAPEARRGPKRKEEPKPAGESTPSAMPPPTTTPFTAAAQTPIQPVARTAREAEFLAMADELKPEREHELIELVWQRNSAWYQMNRRPGMTDKELIQRAIRDGKLTASDLRK